VAHRKARTRSVTKPPHRLDYDAMNSFGIGEDVVIPKP